MNANDQNHRAILKSIAHRVMLERGLLPDFSTEALAELGRLQVPAVTEAGPAKGPLGIRDMRNLLWASIDNDDSRDLDQLTVVVIPVSARDAEAMSAGKVKILVAIADVDSSVKNGSAIDAHARNNTTSVYTAAEIFPMLPEKVSTDITSLNFNEDRLAIIVEMVVGTNGSLQESNIYKAWVRNHAKLAYNSVAAWLEKKGDIPEEIAAMQGLAENLQMQDRVAQSLKNFRHINGALSLETIETKPVFDGDQIRSLEIEEKNRAKELIEDFMVAANGVTARYLSARKSPSIRRVVRTPKRWERIVEIAADHKFKLPELPDSKALEEFLVKQKAADPLRFPDLSLAVIKLLGNGEYIVELPEGNAPGHFGLAVKDYAHSTAPNRRYPDLLTQRLLKASLNGKPAPYSKDELDILAAHCTEAEDAATKVERQVGKSAAALLLESRIGEQFDSIVTGASEKGTWVRLLNVPVEGKLVQGFEGLDVGDQIRVQLISLDVQRGFIDFRKINSSRH
ncbi:MAG: RNB domain-containing ribonuclease [Candidatus Atribacteria bacterium]|nr:RNB domain-containing ribonuclease [Candidatus Atribacteria bacterium]